MRTWKIFPGVKRMPWNTLVGNGLGGGYAIHGGGYGDGDATGDFHASGDGGGRGRIMPELVSPLIQEVKT